MFFYFLSKSLPVLSKKKYFGKLIKHFWYKILLNEKVIDILKYKYQHIEKFLHHFLCQMEISIL